MHDDIFARIVIDRIASSRHASFAMSPMSMTPIRTVSMLGVPISTTRQHAWER